MVAGTTCPEYTPECTDKEIRERLVRIETLLASEHELNIPARVASLEAERDQRTGAYAILGLMCSVLGAVISKVFWN